MKYYSVILLVFFGCGKSTDKNILTKVTNEASKIIWRVDSLDIPICKLCEEAQMKLNLLFTNTEINVGDRIVLNGEKLLQISSKGDTLRNNYYTFEDSILSIYGSDWEDMAEIVKVDKKNLILRKAQKIISKVDSEPISNDLVIYFSKE